MQVASSDNRGRLQTAWIGALGVLIAAALLLSGLNGFSMWFDEIRMVLPTLAWNPLDLDTWVFRPGHPPLYFILLRGWVALGGQSDFSLRMLSGLFGVLTAALIVRIGKDLSHGLFGGFAAALLFGAMGTARYYVHETHNYALLMLACMLLLLFYLRWRAHPKRRVYVVGSVLATAGVMYTHYYGAYFILALNVFVLIAGWRRVRDIYRWIGFQLLAAVLYIPWLGVIVFLVQKVLSRLDVKRRGIKAGGINTDSTKLATIVSTVNTLLADQLVVFALLTLAGVVGVVLLARARRGQGRKTLDPVLLLAILILFSLVAGLAVNLLYRTFTARRVIYVLPTLALLLGYMLIGLPRYVREVVLVAAVSLIFSAGYSSFLPRDWAFRQMIQTVAAGYQPGDLVFLQVPAESLPGQPLTYYADTLLPPHTAVMTLDDAGLNTEDSRQYFVSQVFAPRMLARDTFWVISSNDPVYGEPSLGWVSLLDRSFTQKMTARVGLFTVSQYTAQPQLRGRLRGGRDVSSVLGLPLTLGDNQFELDRAQIDVDTVHPGDTVTIWLDWRALTPPDQDYAVFVHLMKGSTLVAQQDGDPQHMGHPLPAMLWPTAAQIFDERRLTIPDGTPYGAYALVIGLYSRLTGDRLQVVQSEVTIDGIMLDAIQVVNP